MDAIRDQAIDRLLRVEVEINNNSTQKKEREKRRNTYKSSSSTRSKKRNISSHYIFIYC